MSSVWNVLKRLHNDERGAEGLEKLLIIAAVVLPLLGLLIYARNWINEWVGEEAEETKSIADDFDASGTLPN